MKECPAMIAALPREVKPLVRGWKEQRLPGKIVVYSNDFAVVAALSVRPASVLISVGLAGACDPALRVGDIVRAGLVVDSRTGERFGDAQLPQVLVSAAGIASVREKARLYASYRASAVDMEAAAVARAAQMRGLSFKAIKAISDDAAFELKELARFGTQDGQFREAAFAAYVAVRPHLWTKLFQLAGNGHRAIAALTAELESQLDLYRQRD
jgi:adenosylhomocysteine nucleosidase